MESTNPSQQNLPHLHQSPWWPWRCAALFGLSVAFWASPGWAQNSTPGLTASDFTLTLQAQAGDNWVDLSIADAATYLNQARCQCATPVRILVQMASASRSKLSGLTTTGTNARLYVGMNCVQLNTAVIPPMPQCPDSQKLGELNGLSALSANGSWAVDTTVDKLFAAAGDCNFTLSTAIWLWLDSTGTGYPDSGVTGTSAPYLGIQLDGTAPEAPSGIAVEGGDQALVVSWTPVSAADWPDLAGYLVFCMRGNGLQVFNPSYYSNQYLTGQLLCSASAPVAPTASTPSSAAGITSAVEVEAPSYFQNLDPAYLCSGLLPPTQTSVRLGTLQNGILYTVGVAAVDNSGNASPIQSGFVQFPTATGGTTAGLGKSGCGCRLVDMGTLEASASPFGPPPATTPRSLPPSGTSGPASSPPHPLATLAPSRSASPNPPAMVRRQQGRRAPHATGVDRGAVPWGAMLALGVASRLRRRGKRQRRSS